LIPLQRGLCRPYRFGYRLGRLGFAGISFARRTNRDAALGASGTLTSSRKDSRSIVVHEHLRRVLANNLGSNVGDEAAEHHEETISAEGVVGEAPRVVADEGELADLANEPEKNSLA
jgi:hypothetical protein